MIQIKKDDILDRLITLGFKIIKKYNIQANLIYENRIQIFNKYRI